MPCIAGQSNLGPGRLRWFGLPCIYVLRIQRTAPWIHQYFVPVALQTLRDQRMAECGAHKRKPAFGLCPSEAGQRAERPRADAGQSGSSPEAGGVHASAIEVAMCGQKSGPCEFH